MIQGKRFGLCGAEGRHVAPLEGGTVVACSNLDEVQEYDLFEIRRSHLGNPGVVVRSESDFLLQGLNLALHLGHLVV